MVAVSAAAVADARLEVFQSLSPILHAPLHKTLIVSVSKRNYGKNFTLPVQQLANTHRKDVRVCVYVCVCV